MKSHDMKKSCLGQARLSTLSFCMMMAITYFFLSKIALATNILQVVNDAWHNDPIYLAAKSQQYAELEKLPEARSFLLPAVSTNVNQTYTDESLSAPDLPFVTPGSADYQSHSYGISLRQVLFNKELFANYKQAKLTASLAQLELNIIENDLILRVANAYFAMLNAKKKVELAIANVKATKEQYDLIKQQFTADLTTNADLQQAQAHWQLAVADEASAQNEALDARLDVEALAGQQYEVFSEVDFTSRKKQIHSTQHSAEVTLNGNLDYLKNEISLEIAKKNLSAQKAKHYPTMELIVDRNINAQDGSLSGPASRNQRTQALVQLSLPIFEGGRVKSLTDAARYELDAARQNLKNTRVTVLREAQSLVRESKMLDKKLTALNKAISAGELALQARKERFKQGIDDNFSVLEAQQELFESELKAQETHYEWFVVWLQYQKNVGSLSLDSLMLGSSDNSVLIQ